MVLKEGSTFPEGVEFKYVPIDVKAKSQNFLSCDRPLELSLDKLFDKHKGSNVLFVSVPGAFTPTCTENHIPPFLKNLHKLQEEKNIGAVVILSANDAFVLNAWGKLLLQDVQIGDSVPELIFASDPNAKFSQDNELSVDASANGMGIRTARYAFIVGPNREVKYLGKEVQREVKYSGIDAVLSARL